MKFAVSLEQSSRYTRIAYLFARCLCAACQSSGQPVRNVFCGGRRGLGAAAAAALVLVRGGKVEGGGPERAPSLVKQKNKDGGGRRAAECGAGNDAQFSSVPVPQCSVAKWSAWPAVDTLPLCPVAARRVGETLEDFENKFPMFLFYRCTAPRSSRTLSFTFLVQFGCGVLYDATRSLSIALGYIVTTSLSE